MRRLQDWRLLVLGFVVLYFIYIDNLMKVRPDHAFLSLLIVALVLKNAKRFLLDWSPFILLWIAYDFMRGVADDNAGRIHILGPYLFERRLFEPLCGSLTPNDLLLQFQAGLGDAPLRHVLDSLSSGFYAIHMAAPIVLAWIFWSTLKDREIFYRFMLTLCLTTWVSYATYFLYPAAPPWYVRDFGFVQPQAAFKGSGAGNLLHTDKWIGIPLFESVYKHMNPNKFAAIPSLHSAFPLLIYIYGLKKFGRRGIILALYPLGVWWSAVYLDHHYVIDIILAVLYVAACMVVSEKLIFPALYGRKGIFRRILWKQASPD
ncbi:MAG: phosphatase PAP2 family protein [Candidatus Eisenbacteria bacterium]|uniref:Phosphatase PAP2 family protein n=1 Tax=Eiseniibacteriota bacterium TaxID=2212470 RepID=A0A948RWT9_UNCEI|nr:phosphatase PAP2 family protein [Candidatus Eisenbacteria bacterium]MBU1950192.1 phosphatase PAP2 family protein [Candidatus Eisenbacteria bacterium]MBU2691411.1 phosphatase PAP2 family protein [Candidatus Eisenbacteria bacterium]